MWIDLSKVSIISGALLTACVLTSCSYDKPVWGQDKDMVSADPSASETATVARSAVDFDHELDDYTPKKDHYNKIDKLAVLVCDINGLKHVNDTQGHAAGDKLIKDASAMICEYFTHGAVYRIGGDEFVVVLQEKGYDTMHEVLREINRVIENNILRKEVVISIGYSELTPDDQLLHDVFERADQMMYQRKQHLKQMGAPTRSDS